MKYILLSVSLLLFVATNSFAQKKPKFNDGVYASHTDLKKNNPSYELFKIPDFDYKLDSEKNILFLSNKSLQKLAESEIKSMDNIWGICIKGKPYMKIQPTDNKEEVYFVRYYILGSICYLYYPVFQEKSVEMFVHNPYTGQKVGSKTITNKEKKFVKKLMRFDTGEVKPYNSDNFMAMIQDDPKLVETLKDLSQKDLEKKLFKSIKIYNDRNPILVAQ
jgi:hypothetical protein